MPIRPENRKYYKGMWSSLSECIRVYRAKNKCEKCKAKNKKPHPITKSKVVLTVAHLDHNPSNYKLSNLMALCQRCHNQLDAKSRIEGMKKRGVL